MSSSPEGTFSIEAPAGNYTLIAAYLTHQTFKKEIRLTGNQEFNIEMVSNDGQMNLALAPNPDLDVFKSFRCFDDFEGQPLHGTILVDGKGRIRWQDIGYEPFMDVGFLHEEATRLLALPE